MRIFKAIFAFGIVAMASAGYAEPSASSLENLRAPPSPAMIALGVTPSEIQRPTSAAQAAVSLLAGLKGQNNNSSVPTDVAIEFAPYWLWSHPALTFDDYWNQGVEALWQELTVSIATTQAPGSTQTTTAADLAVGVRTTLISGKDREATESCHTKIIELTNSISNAALEIPPGTPIENKDAVLKTIQDKYKSEIEATQMLCQPLLEKRNGFSLDLAGAYVARFDGADYSEGRNEAVYAWLTPALTSDSISTILMGRFGRAGMASGSIKTNVDCGFRFVGAWSTFSLSAEAIYRYSKAGGASTSELKYDGMAEVLIADGVWLSFTLGRDFAPADSDSQPIIALSGIQWNFGERVVGKQ